VNFACAFGSWCDGGAVVIARDTRRSSVVFRAAAAAGLLSTGAEVIDLGVASTPLVSFAVRELGANGGISISGSHNDARWNALKFIGPDGALLNAVKSGELLDLYHTASFNRAPWNLVKPACEPADVSGRYLDHLLANLDVEPIRNKGFRVAVDFCNGSAGIVAKRFLSALGCRLLPINEEPNGEFAHPPAPTVANMRQLAALMRYLQADLGAALNVDGDRVAFVTDGGTPLSEEFALPLAAMARLRSRPGTVVTNLSSSGMVEAVAESFGQPVVRAPVGESHVVDLGLAEAAVLVGEGSGGVAALPASMTFDGLLTLGLVLEEMAVSGSRVEVLVEGLPRFVMVKRQLPCPPNLVYKVLDRFRGQYATQEPDTTDGVRVAWPDAWLHVRASNTEPLLRIIGEARESGRAREVVDEALAFARRLTYAQGGH